MKVVFRARVVAVQAENRRDEIIGDSMGNGMDLHANEVPNFWNIVSLGEPRLKVLAGEI